MNYVEKLVERFPKLSTQKQAILDAVQVIEDAYKSGKKILIAGNGGSAADSEHMSGELLKGFISKRPMDSDKAKLFDGVLKQTEIDALQEGVQAIPLTALISGMTAFSNDVGYEMAFAQLVFSLGKAGDVFVAISTSGNSSNVLKAVSVAKTLGLKVIGLTGKDGGKLSKVSDVVIVAPAFDTYLVQEYHLPIYHAICAQVEADLFNA